jgi:hypothetical protein
MGDNQMDLECTDFIEAYIDLDRAELLKILHDLQERSIERSSHRYLEPPHEA